MIPDVDPDSHHYPINRGGAEFLRSQAAQHLLTETQLQGDQVEGVMSLFATFTEGREMQVALLAHAAGVVDAIHWITTGQVTAPLVRLLPIDMRHQLAEVWRAQGMVAVPDDPGDIDAARRAFEQHKGGQS